MRYTNRRLLYFTLLYFTMMSYCAKLTGEELSRYLNKIASGLRNAQCQRQIGNIELTQSVYISLPYIMAVRTAGIDMTKLRHCHPMYNQSISQFISQQRQTSNIQNGTNIMFSWTPRKTLSATCPTLRSSKHLNYFRKGGVAPFLKFQMSHWRQDPPPSQSLAT